MTPKYITIAEFCMRNPRYHGLTRSICSRINCLPKDAVRRHTYPHSASTYHPDDLLKVAQQLCPDETQPDAPPRPPQNIERTRALYSKQLASAVTSMLRICINDCLATPDPDNLAAADTALNAAYLQLRQAIANMQSILRLEQQQ